jgi:hypothetical protein
MNGNSLKEIRKPPPELIIQLLDKARSSLNEAAREGAEQSAWADYRKAEVLYATALFQVLRNQLLEAHAFAKEAEQQVQQLKRQMTNHINPTRESTNTQLEECSLRMEKLRESFRSDKANLSPSRISRCMKAFYQAREKFNMALGAFVSSDYSHAEESLVGTRSHLDAVERLLHQRYENEDGGYGVQLDDVH